MVKSCQCVPGPLWLIIISINGLDGAGGEHGYRMHSWCSYVAFGLFWNQCWHHAVHPGGARGAVGRLLGHISLKCPYIS